MTKEAVGSRVRLDAAQNEEDDLVLIYDSFLETEDPGPMLALDSGPHIE